MVEDLQYDFEEDSDRDRLVGEKREGEWRLAIRPFGKKETQEPGVLSLRACVCDLAKHLDDLDNLLATHRAVLDRDRAVLAALEVAARPEDGVRLLVHADHAHVLVVAARLRYPSVREKIAESESEKKLKNSPKGVQSLKKSDSASEATKRIPRVHSGANFRDKDSEKRPTPKKRCFCPTGRVIIGTRIPGFENTSTDEVV